LPRIGEKEEARKTSAILLWEEKREKGEEGIQIILGNMSCPQDPRKGSEQV